MTKIVCLFFLLFSRILISQVSNDTVEMLFDFDNTFKPEYSGFEDEIIQKIEASQPSLSCFERNPEGCIIGRKKEKTSSIRVDSILSVKKVTGYNFKERVALSVISVSHDKYLLREKYWGDTCKKQPLGPPKHYQPPTSALVVSGEWVHLIAPSTPRETRLESHEEKWKVLLMSIVDGEFIPYKVFDSTGFLIKYSLYGPGFHCPLFKSCCTDIYENENGTVSWRIHHVDDSVGWNCMGNRIFGCMKAGQKDSKQNKLISEVFRYRKKMFAKEGKTIYFFSPVSKGLTQMETWQIIKEDREEIIMERTACELLKDLPAELKNSVQKKP
jgi:hypothetical protein